MIHDLWYCMFCCTEECGPGLEVTLEEAGLHLINVIHYHAPKLQYSCHCIGEESKHHLG